MDRRSCTWHAHLLKTLNPALICLAFAQNSGSRLYNSYCQRVRSKCKNLTAGNTEYDLRFHLIRTVNIYIFIYSPLPQSYQSPSTLVFASFLYTCRGLLIHPLSSSTTTTICTDHECSYRRNGGMWWSSCKTYTYIHPPRASATSQQLFHFQGWSPSWILSSFQPLSFFLFSQ